MSVYTGIDIGSNQVKFAVCEPRGSIHRLAAAPIPDDLVRNGCIVSPEAMSDFLRASARRLKIKARNCAVILPAALAFTRRFSMPLMTEDELKINLPYEFRDYITLEKDKYTYDYAVLNPVWGKAAPPAELSLMATAALKETTATYAAMLRRAGFRLRIAAPVEFAYVNLLRRYAAAHPGQLPLEFCIIDLGHSATRIYIFNGTRFEVTRVVEMGCGLLDAAIADQLHVDTHIAASYKRINHNDVQSLDACREIYHNIAIEIMRAVNFYGFSNPGRRLTDAFFCGGGASIPLLLERISAVIGLTLHGIDELLSAGKQSRENLLLSPAACGITLQ